MENQTTAVTPISQTTDRGINNLSFTETLNASTAPQFPILPRFTSWDRWLLRWVGCFCFGVSLPSWLMILPPIGALTFSTIALLGALILGGWSIYRRENAIPAAVTVLVISVGTLFAIATHSYHHAESESNPKSIPTIRVNL